jgi:hypothetical protein
MFNNMPWSATPKLDEEWKVVTATNMLNSLSESKYYSFFLTTMVDLHFLINKNKD